MISFIKAIFSKPETLELPKPGDIFTLKNGDPFERISARIVDVKDGWVKYSFVQDYVRINYCYTMNFKEFAKIYGPIK